jgi:hypothetical protein
MADDSQRERVVPFDAWKDEHGGDGGSDNNRFVESLRARLGGNSLLVEA